MTVRILTGDCRDMLATLPDASVHCCVTSPPYFGLRDYGTAQWGDGDADCDHTPGKTLLYGSKSETAAGQIRGGPFKDVCGKCGATRIDRQMGLEPTPSCNRQGLMRLRGDLTEAQRQFVALRLLGAELPGA